MLRATTPHPHSMAPPTPGIINCHSYNALFKRVEPNLAVKCPLLLTSSQLLRSMPSSLGFNLFGQRKSTRHGADKVSHRYNNPLSWTNYHVKHWININEK
jgi:hypothetical protein